MDHIPLSVTRITPEEEELIAYFRMLPPDIQAGIAYTITANLPERPKLTQGMTYLDGLKLVSAK